MSNAALFTLLQISDSIFPIGSYTQSNGLETYVQKNIVKDSASAKKYLYNMLCYNIKYGDGLGMKLAYEAALGKDIEYLQRIDNILHTSKGAKEIREGSLKLCLRFLKLINKFDEKEAVLKYSELIKNGKCYGVYSIAFGIFAAESNISLDMALSAYIYNQCSSIINNCAKLIPIGQMDGQSILFNMQSTMEEVKKDIIGLSEEELGRCCPAFEIRAMQHEELYSRLYMS
ncbi:urease accessory protein UreF [Clostridium sp. 19966]|uniref:urease accessory protein UreF n=1 Tax=Clostridium sp. 19966 TaxID=2768166 RepID=UPI0028DF8117|nr:urease accessory protein UreF [Clostridium sp. 19966]MDT8715654.1 urease accessory protein UreF [Clostridium sp. 19966]